MKRTTILALMLLTFSIVSAQQKFTIKGNMPGLQDGRKLSLSWREDGKQMQDSARVRNGAFTFTGKVAEPVRAYLELEPMQRDTGEMTYEKYMARDMQDFFLENTAMTVKGDKAVKTATISGGKTQADYKTLTAQKKPLFDKQTAMRDQIRGYDKQKNQKAIDSLLPALRVIGTDMNKVDDNFIKSHPDSYMSMDLLKERSYVIELENFEPLYNALSANLKNTPSGKKLAEKMELAKKTSVGRPALEFTQQTTEQKPFSLASLKGKYVLVDFWASWCGPCRAENPNVVKAYNEFKDKNFEIVGVSLDDKRQPWLDAIQKDGLPWVHVSDLKGWKNDVAVLYGINAVPQNFLLDPNGVIIAKNLRGEELSKKLGELIK